VGFVFNILALLKRDIRSKSRVTDSFKMKYTLPADTNHTSQEQQENGRHLNILSQFCNFISKKKI